jgi:hypothetical protein
MGILAMPGKLLYLVGKARGAARISLVLRILLLSECALGGGRPIAEPHDLAHRLAARATFQNEHGGVLRPSFADVTGPTSRIAADLDAPSVSRFQQFQIKRSKAHQTSSYPGIT